TTPCFAPTSASRSRTSRRPRGASRRSADVSGQSPSGTRRRECGHFPDATGRRVLARSLRPPERAPFANPETPALQLGLPGFRSADLHDARRLADLTRAFDDFLREADSALFARYRAHRDGSAPVRGPEESALLLEAGAQVSRLLGRLFGVERDLKRLREAAGREAPLFRVKRDFVQRRVFRKGPKDRPRASDFSALDAEVRPLLAAAACRDPRASFARNDAELLVAIVIETLLE